jgi:hypothetical protein
MIVGEVTPAGSGEAGNGIFVGDVTTEGSVGDDVVSCASFVVAEELLAAFFATAAAALSKASWRIADGWAATFSFAAAADASVAAWLVGAAIMDAG